VIVCVAATAIFSNSLKRKRRIIMRTIKFLLAILFSLAVAACGGGGGGSAAPATTTTTVVGSSASGSGSTAVFTKNGATYALAPSAAGAGAVKLLSLPNTGPAVGAVTVSQVSATPITTSLTVVNGTSVDPAHDVGMAFNYHDKKISLFKLSTKTEVGTFDTLTANTLSYSGAGSIMIAGAVMNPANQTMIIATADGFEVVNYTNPAAATKLREIPSLAVDPTNGVEIMENFAFDPALPNGGSTHPIIITGGDEGGSTPVMVLIDSDTGKVYKPDAATAALFVAPSQYIDSAAVDTVYHVAILADESNGTTFVNLNQLTLNATAGTYTLPTAAVKLNTMVYYKKDNLGIESTNHLVMMGGGCGGIDLVAAQLNAPPLLGFSKEVVVTMPAGVDDKGASVSWYGWCDPHGAGAYLTPSDHPTSPSTSLALWLNSSADHIAVIDLKGVLDGTLAGGAYNPTATTPKDIAYFAIP
jgi:hypothetical protein